MRKEEVRYVTIGSEIHVHRVDLDPDEIESEIAAGSASAREGPAIQKGDREYVDFLVEAMRRRYESNHAEVR